MKTSKTSNDRTPVDLISQNLVRKSTFLEKLITRYKLVTILAASFALVILTGSILLALPFSNKGASVSYLTHLFVATSAVCVTGLSPVTVADQYTLFGKSVLILLMQIGGLGLMTFVALVINFGKNRASFKELQALADATGKSGYYDVAGYVRRIVKYTVFFELIGFILISIRFTDDFGIGQGLFNALFVSVAAFTNAGFDCFASNSLGAYATDPLVSLTVMALIVIGGLGFIVWIEIKHHLQTMKEHRLPLRSFFPSFSAHTKTVVVVTLILILSGTLIFMTAEFSNPNTLGPYNLWEKFLVSGFQSITLRTAGFSTISIASCRRFTLLIMCIFMLIGGSPGSTAGGIKTTTVAVILVMLRSFMKQELDNCNLFHRRIRRRYFINAELVMTSYLFFLVIGIIALVGTESSIPTLHLVFEAVSAIATVGLTADTTVSLSVAGKLIIIVLMFIGRIGPIAMIEIFQRTLHKPPHNNVQYPPANIMIG
ncbi:MAG: TrkH family potassium uptake protein [Lachnospiraceae bacterium]|nr:TrkH family potassium uptake protein [Lachnospiraceae bacterium]